MQAMTVVVGRMGMRSRWAGSFQAGRSTVKAGRCRDEGWLTAIRPTLLWIGVHR
jgi:hypothetical protein